MSPTYELNPTIWNKIPADVFEHIKTFMEFSRKSSPGTLMLIVSDLTPEGTRYTYDNIDGRLKGIFTHQPQLNLISPLIPDMFGMPNARDVFVRFRKYPKVIVCDILESINNTPQEHAHNIIQYARGENTIAAIVIPNDKSANFWLHPMNVTEMAFAIPTLE